MWREAIKITTTTLFGILILLVSESGSQELIIGSGQNFVLSEGRSSIHYSRLVLKPNSSIQIPESYSGMDLTIRADYFEAAESKIFQYFSTRAPNGINGSKGGDGPRGHHDGGPGGVGGQGNRGNPTVQLKLELGIAKLKEMTILLRSQAGGHGGFGGKGGKGGRATCGSRQHGGNGGQGGKGGAGGPPGSAGPVNIVWWPVGNEIPRFQNDQPVGLAVVLQIGDGGWGGLGGVGGDPGDGRSCFPSRDQPGGYQGKMGPPGVPFTGHGAYLPITFEHREVPK